MIAAAAVSALGLAGVSLLVAGGSAWRLYLTKTLPFQRLLEEHSTGVFQAMTPSPFMAGRLLGLPLDGAYALQAIVSLACAILVIAHFWRLRPERRLIEPLDILLLLTCGFLASPYGFNYDMAGLCVVILLAERSDPGLENLAAWRGCVACLWAAPIVMVIVPVALSARGLGLWPIGPPLVAAGLMLLVTAIVQRGRPSPPSGARPPAKAHSGGPLPPQKIRRSVREATWPVTDPLAFGRAGPEPTRVRPPSGARRASGDLRWAGAGDPDSPPRRTRSDPGQPGPAAGSGGQASPPPIGHPRRRATTKRRPRHAPRVSSGRSRPRPWPCPRRRRTRSPASASWPLPSRPARAGARGPAHLRAAARTPTG